MAQTDNGFLKFWEKIKLDSVNVIFLSLLAALIIGFSVFYVVMNIQSSKQQEQAITAQNLELRLKEEQHNFLNDLHEIREKTYLYKISGGATDRFQALYALKNSGQSFQTLSNDLISDIKDPEVSKLLINIKQAATIHNNQLLGILSGGSALPDFMNANTGDSTGIKLYSQDLAGGSDFDTKLVESKTHNIEDLMYQLNVVINKFIEQQRTIMSHNERGLLAGFIIFSILITYVLATILRKRLAHAIDESGQLLKRISRGELPEKVDSLGNVFESIRASSDMLVDYLKDVSQFARQIGDMKFDDQFKPKSENDTLGNSLLEMRDRLQTVARETSIRDWNNQGQSMFADILRQSSEEMEHMGDKLIANMVEYLGASQGALFMINDLDESHKYLELLSAYAFDRKKIVEKRLEIGEGLVGQVYQEGKTVYMTDIRFDHFNIVTGLGESRPSALLIVPLKEENDIEGVVELATFNRLEEYQIHFVEKVGEIIASYIRSGKVNRTTRLLLEETQEKAEQMKAQEEELRQNMEELAATQEQVERRNKELEEIQNRLNEEQYLLSALLTSTHDYIYFKDQGSRFIRVSDSMVKLFGKNKQEEVIGKSDFDFQGKEHAQEAYDDEQQIIRSGEPMLDAVEKENWEDGHITWVSTTKNPLKDQNGKIIGTFGISRDITKSKLSEVEVKKQKEWLENYFKFTEHIFVVTDQRGTINFATKSMLDHLNRETFQGLEFGDLFQTPSLTDFLHKIQYNQIDARETTMAMQLNNDDQTSIQFLCYASKNENEDGTRNVFIIGQ